MLRRMADIKQHYTKEESGKYKCNYCGRDIAANTSTTRLRGHISGTPNLGITACTKVKRQRTPTGYIPFPLNLLPVETEGTTAATTLVLQPNGSGANNYLGNQGQENHLREDPDMIPGLQSGANNHNIPILSPELNNYSVGELQYMMSIYESASVENLFLRNVTNFGEPSEAVNGWPTQPVERGSTHQSYPLTTTDLPLANESCGNLEPEAFPPTYLVTQECRDCCFTVDANQHGVGDAANQTGNNRVSPNVLTDQNGVQSGEGRVHVEVPSAEVSSNQRTRGEGIVQSSNERQDPKEEAWIIFTQELGNCITQVEELAKAVSRECAGLPPLVIKVMARSMNGICDVRTWRKTLDELKESKGIKGHEMREEGFSVLKFSYLRLNDPALQECLSYCTLFPEDYKIGRGELIEYMIAEGIIDERKSRQEELDKGHTMLDTLEHACFLEGDTKTVRMHHLIRGMAIYELRERSNTLVTQLKELPDVEKWTENLVRVSLIGNDIEEIPSSYTPKCPNLSTLLLCRNHRLKKIADSFFEHLQWLKILDLTSCQEIEELPGSISALLNLTALLLRDCKSLIYVPSVANLKQLKKLDLSRCERLKQMPAGVGVLLNLKYLDLSSSGIEETASGIIPKLSQLQCLKLCGEWGDSELSFRGSEVGGLEKLETLHCKFSDPNEFGEYMKSREKSQQSPSDYSIFIKRENSFWPTTSRKRVSVTDYSHIDVLALPTDIETLNIYNCCGTLSKRLLESLPNLQEIRVCEEKGECLFSNYSTRSLPSHFLHHLKLINIDNCDELKKLFPPSLLPYLHNLQIISVEHCHGMEELFSTDQEEEDGQALSFDQPNLTGLNLSRLTTLKLRYLPELRSIYKGAVICQSLQEIELRNCPKLQRITLPLPQPSLKRIHVYPGEWLNSVQWGSANDKNDLKSLS